MDDSRDFQDSESVRSGHSHVASQPESFPPHPVPGGMGRQVFGTHGISGNVFANPSPSSSAPYPQESNPWSSNVSEHTSHNTLPIFGQSWLFPADSLLGVFVFFAEFSKC